MFPKWYQASSNLELDAVKDIDKDQLNIFNHILEKMMKNVDREVLDGSKKEL